MTDEILILVSHLKFYEEEANKHLDGISNIRLQIEEAKREVNFKGNVWYCNKCCRILRVHDKKCPVCKEDWDIIETDLSGHIRMLVKSLTDKRVLFNNIMDELDKFEHYGNDY